MFCYVSDCCYVIFCTFDARPVFVAVVFCVTILLYDYIHVDTVCIALYLSYNEVAQLLLLCL